MKEPVAEMIHSVLEREKSQEPYSVAPFTLLPWRCTAVPAVGRASLSSSLSSSDSGTICSRSSFDLAQTVGRKRATGKLGGPPVLDSAGRRRGWYVPSSPHLIVGRTAVSWEDEPTLAAGKQLTSRSLAGVFTPAWLEPCSFFAESPGKISPACLGSSASVAELFARAMQLDTSLESVVWSRSGETGGVEGGSCGLRAAVDTRKTDSDEARLRSRPGEFRPPSRRRRLRGDGVDGGVDGHILSGGDVGASEGDVILGVPSRRGEVVCDREKDGTVWEHRVGTCGRGGGGGVISVMTRRSGQ